MILLPERYFLKVTGNAFCVLGRCTYGETLPRSWEFFAPVPLNQGLAEECVLLMSMLRKAPFVFSLFCHPMKRVHSQLLYAKKPAVCSEQCLGLSNNASDWEIRLHNGVVHQGAHWGSRAKTPCHSHGLTWAQMLLFCWIWTWAARDGLMHCSTPPLVFKKISSIWKELISFHKFQYERY